MTDIESDCVPTNSGVRQSNLVEIESNGLLFAQAPSAALILLSNKSCNGLGVCQFGVMYEDREDPEDDAIHTVSFGAQLLPIGDTTFFKSQYANIKSFEQFRKSFEEDATAHLYAQTLLSANEPENILDAYSLLPIFMVSRIQHEILDAWSQMMQNSIATWPDWTPSNPVPVHPSLERQTLATLPSMLGCTYKNGCKLHMQQGVSIRWRTDGNVGYSLCLWRVPRLISQEEQRLPVLEAMAACEDLRGRLVQPFETEAGRRMMNPNLEFKQALFSSIEDRQHHRAALYELLVASRVMFVDSIESVIKELDEEKEWELQWVPLGTSVRSNSSLSCKINTSLVPF